MRPHRPEPAMQFAIEHQPSFAWLRVQLGPHERVDAEAGAMVTMTPSLAFDTRLNASRRAGVFSKLGSFFRAAMRKMLGGETMFINEFSSPSGGEVVLAPRLSGAIIHHQLTGGPSLFVQAGSYLASAGQVETQLRWGGLRSLFGGEGLVLLGCSGQGDVFVNSYGGIVEIPVDGSYTVDTGHLVCFEGTLDFSIKSVGGMKSLLFSGEGLVIEFRGRGKVWIQSRNVNQLVGWLTRLLP
jgi:uncharacterized protein (TIGR00266 family)